MATETTRLLDSCIVHMPKDQNNEDWQTELSKTKGLSFEELKQFENDPWWQNLRKTFFLSYWVTVITIFIAACILSVLGHGKCEPTAISNISKQVPLTKMELLKAFTQTTQTTATTMNVTRGEEVVGGQFKNVISTSEKQLLIK